MFVKLLLIVLIVITITYLLKPELFSYFIWRKKEGLTPLDVDTNYKFNNVQQNSVVTDVKEFLNQNNTNDYGKYTTESSFNQGPVQEPEMWNEYFSKLSTGLQVPTTSTAPSTTNDSKHDTEQNYGKDDLQLFSDKFKQQDQSKPFDPKEFLPQEINDEWFQSDLSNLPNMNQEKLIEISKDCIGINTVGNSMKNPSYDIRGNIPNPKINVGPFLNSSYDPDTNIRSLCH